MSRNDRIGSSPTNELEFDPVFDDDHVIAEAGTRGVRRALLEHKRSGLPIVVMQNGKIVWIPPEEIRVDETEA